mmetsp:Transcript_23852/g.81570  ORF Transcript_23852/g.81570 Transcript_23852/m.81570 type:complete len:209 (-) Transcript_23852:236-862(-)
MLSAAWAASTAGRLDASAAPRARASATRKATTSVAASSATKAARAPTARAARESAPPAQSTRSSKQTTTWGTSSSREYSSRWMRPTSRAMRFANVFQSAGSQSRFVSRAVCRSCDRARPCLRSRKERWYSAQMRSSGSRTTTAAASKRASAAHGPPASVRAGAGGAAVAARPSAKSAAKPWDVCTLTTVWPRAHRASPGRMPTSDLSP